MKPLETADILAGAVTLLCLALVAVTVCGCRPTATTGTPTPSAAVTPTPSPGASQAPTSTAQQWLPPSCVADPEGFTDRFCYKRLGPHAPADSYLCMEKMPGVTPQGEWIWGAIPGMPFLPFEAGAAGLDCLVDLSPQVGALKPHENAWGWGNVHEIQPGWLIRTRQSGCTWIGHWQPLDPMAWGRLESEAAECRAAIIAAYGSELLPLALEPSHWFDAAGGKHTDWPSN